jgi:ATP-binding cassette subfamily C protein
MLPSLLRLLGLDGGPSATLPLGALGQVLGLEGALLAYLVLAAVGGVVVYGHAVAVQGLVQDYGDGRRRRLLGAVLAMTWGAPPLRRPAELVHALTQESAQNGFATRQFLNLLGVAAQLPALLAAALAISLPFTLAAVGVSALLLLALLPLSRRAHALASAQVEAGREVHAGLAEQLAGFRTLKILGAEAKCLDDLDLRLDRLRRAQMDQTRAVAAGTQIQRLIMAMAAAAGVWVGLGWLRVPTADLLALVLLFGRIVMVGSRFQEQVRQLLRLLPVHASLERRLRACRAAAEPKSAVPLAPCRLQREIRLERLGFAVPGEPAILSGLDAVIPAGGITALSGPSGAGKSTLADLLMGLSAPTAGRLLIDGVPLDGAARLAWRSQVAYVPQDCFLFNDTIRANLRLACPQADDAALWGALEQAAADFVRTLPQSLETSAGDRGLRLSGGERQRILLARALLQRADLLVLDEATSALDEAAETQVLAALERMRGRVTMVVISHRPRLAAIADQVIRLDLARGTA